MWLKIFGFRPELQALSKSEKLIFKLYLWTISFQLLKITGNGLTDSKKK